MIIDSHQHVFWHGRDDKGLIADLDEHGIDKAWLLTWEPPVTQDSPGYHYVLDPINLRADGTHAGITLETLVRVRDKYPTRFEVGYCPNPELATAPDLLEAAYRIHGVRICGEWKFRTLFDDPRCINLYRKAGELGCPIVLHLDIPFIKNSEDKMVYAPLWYGGTVENLERALAACPDANFIGHAPGFWREISGDGPDAVGSYPTGAITSHGRLYHLFETYDNLYADISAGSGLRALKRDPVHAVQFINKFSDRLLFGRDYYGGEHQEFLATLDLDDKVRAKLMGENAQRLLDIANSKAEAITTKKLS